MRLLQATDLPCKQVVCGKLEPLNLIFFKEARQCPILLSKPWQYLKP